MPPAAADPHPFDAREVSLDRRPSDRSPFAAPGRSPTGAKALSRSIPIAASHAFTDLTAFQSECSRIRWTRRPSPDHNRVKQSILRLEISHDSPTLDRRPLEDSSAG